MEERLFECRADRRQKFRRKRRGRQAAPFRMPIIRPDGGKKRKRSMRAHSPPPQKKSQKICRSLLTEPLFRDTIQIGQMIQAANLYRERLKGDDGGPWHDLIRPQSWFWCAVGKGMINIQEIECLIEKYADLFDQ